MKCPNCNEENAEGMKFCCLCGSLLPVGSRTETPSAARTEAPVVASSNCTNSPSANYEWYTDIAESDIYDLKNIIYESKDRCKFDEGVIKYVISFPTSAKDEIQKVLNFITDTKTDVKNHEIKFQSGYEPKILGSRIEFSLEDRFDTFFPYDNNAFSNIKVPFTLCLFYQMDSEYLSEFYARRSADSAFEQVQEFNATVAIRKDECYTDENGNTMLDYDKAWDENGSSCSRYVCNLKKMDFEYVYLVHTPDLNKDKVYVEKAKVYQYNFKPKFLLAGIRSVNDVVFWNEEEKPTLVFDDVCDVANRDYMLVYERDIVKEGKFYRISDSSLSQYKDLADMTGRRLN